MHNINPTVRLVTHNGNPTVISEIRNGKPTELSSMHKGKGNIRNVQLQSNSKNLNTQRKHPKLTTSRQLLNQQRPNMTQNPPVPVKAIKPEAYMFNLIRVQT